MSYFCQFCDKEIVFEGNIVYKKGYITCGNELCLSKADKMAEDIQKECEVKTAKLLIFKSSTPEDSSTWRIVAKKDYPNFIRDEEVLRGLLEGYVIGLQSKDDTVPEMYYCARNAAQVLQQIKENQELEGADE